MLLLGYDIGSSGIKASVVDAETGEQLAAARSPEGELDIQAPVTGWAEQQPETWWKHLKRATALILKKNTFDAGSIQAIGISYQMHGLVVVDKNLEVLRPAIIWCDGRAVDIGRQAFKELGEEYCLQHLLNSPGNFTASKLKWMKEHEPESFDKIYKFMLPGDYIGMKLSGQVATSVSGLSEGILWDHKAEEPSNKLLDYYGIPEDLIPEVFSNFGSHGTLSGQAARELGLEKGIPLSYRSGDQPNNALSLNVMEPGEVASTAGTSGVIYGVTDKPIYDKLSRVNTFLHVNHNKENNRYGVLLCINGTGIQYRWLRQQMLGERMDYKNMNKEAEAVPVGAGGLIVHPFGNGPERVLGDINVGGGISQIDFNRHETAHIIRAVQEGIAFALNYGLEVMREIGLNIDKIRAGSSNMYQSPVFRQAIANASGLSIELYDTDGAMGAAIGAGIGAGIFKDRKEAFKGLNKTTDIEPEAALQEEYQNAYKHWKLGLNKMVDIDND